MSVFTKGNITLLLFTLFSLAPFLVKAQNGNPSEKSYLAFANNLNEYAKGCSEDPKKPGCPEAREKLKEEAADPNCGTPCLVLVETIGSSGCEAGNCNPFSRFALRHLPHILTIRTFDGRGKLNGRSGRGRFFKQNVMYYAKGYSSKSTARMEVKIKGMPKVNFENPALRKRLN